MLAGYNRLLRNWVRNRESSNARAIGLANYERWFAKQGIHLRQNKVSKEWEVESTTVHAYQSAVDCHQEREQKVLNSQGGNRLGRSQML